MKKIMQVIPAAIVLAAILSLLEGCGLTEAYNRRATVDNVGRILGIRLSYSQLITEDDTRDFQGWGYYYAEFDLSGVPPELSQNEHWRELPMEPVLYSFMRGEGAHFGRTFDSPVHGYWFFYSQNGYREGGGGETNWFALGDDYSKIYYKAAFYDEDSGLLTVWFRSR